jgi:hypothetical protein
MELAKIPPEEVELYRAVALAHRTTRRIGGKPHDCHWAATEAARVMKPELSKKEAEEVAVRIIRQMSERFPAWFWK